MNVDCVRGNSGGMKRLHKRADSSHMIGNAFLSGHFALANITTNMLIICKGFREKPRKIIWWGKSFYFTERT